MKRTLTLIASLAICSAMIVSCKNNKTTEPTQEEIQEQKQALADSVLTEIDALAEQFYDTQTKSFRLNSIQLTDEEKTVKPDYLLDLSVASTLVTKSQKVNALAIYLLEMSVRRMFDMPCEEAKETIVKLATEVDHPLDVEYLTSDTTTSEKIKSGYEICKERGDLAYFWQFQYALMSEAAYIIAQDPDLFWSKITDEQSQVFHSRFSMLLSAVEKLAEYDEEMSQLLQFKNKYKMFSSDEDGDSIMQSTDTAKQYIKANYEKFVDRRNALIQ